ncbi:TRAP transporter large permease subunit [Loktanella fryxellensis]|uniref:TRAP transporter large permease subunit n=1 Tax=Loktanella fryxellensis TaxID=245187 RepID=UPI001C4305A7|nr:TRAP transporter large permease subunit [Loktanella fryxellensis]
MDLIRRSPYRPAASGNAAQRGLKEVRTRSHAKTVKTSCITGGNQRSGPAILLLTPILAPVAAQLAVDPVQFGLMMVINLTIGLLTPPVGTALYLASSISGVSIMKLSRAMLPFWVIMLAVLMLVTFVPGFTSWAYSQ